MIRAVIAAEAAPSVIAGSVRCLRSTSNVWSPTIGHIPPVGSQCSFSENTRIDINPSQNAGMLFPNSANSILTRSKTEYCFVAETIPAGSPIASEITVEAAVSSSVFSKRLSTKGSTSVRCWSEVPRSPRRTCSSHLRY